jgi:hypothetical protein
MESRERRFVLVEVEVIGYCIAVSPNLASYRLRVAIPSKHVGPHCYGVGDVTFFYKNGNPTLARQLKGPIVYDVVNAHFDDPDYRAMCEVATTVTCSSQAMAEIIKAETGRDAVVIADPYENAEGAPSVSGDRVLWFGHQANIASLKPYADLPLYVCTAAEWSLESEASALANAGVVLLTGSNPGASANRVVKALRAGRFVVVPEDCPESWKELSELIWIGDVRQGIQWAFSNREEACRKVLQSQSFIKTRFSPQLIGSQWADLFASTLERDTNKKTAGSGLTSQ